MCGSGRWWWWCTFKKKIFIETFSFVSCTKRQGSFFPLCFLSVLTWTGWVMWELYKKLYISSLVSWEQLGTMAKSNLGKTYSFWNQHLSLLPNSKIERKIGRKMSMEKTNLKTRVFFLASCEKLSSFILLEWKQIDLRPLISLYIFFSLLSSTKLNNFLLNRGQASKGRNF